MIGIRLEDPPVALLRLGEVVFVFVEQAQVDQRSHGRRIAGERPLVVFAGLILVADPVGDHSHEEQGAGMPSIDGECLFQGVGDLLRPCAVVG